MALLGHMWAWITDHATVLSAVISATAAVAIAWFTVKLKHVSTKQARLARRAIKLAGDEYLATHRPLLRVRYFKRVDAPTDQMIQVHFTIVNVGDTRAKMLGCNAGIEFFRKDSLPTPVLFHLREALAVRPFGRGATDEATVLLPKDRALLADHLVEQKEMHVYGFIVYADKGGNTRTTAFCRRWDAARDRFTPVDDPDYEYED
jgi:hypothetical protein